MAKLLLIIIACALVCSPGKMGGSLSGSGSEHMCMLVRKSTQHNRHGQFIQMNYGLFVWFWRDCVPHLQCQGKRIKCRQIWLAPEHQGEAGGEWERDRQIIRIPRESSRELWPRDLHQVCGHSLLNILGTIQDGRITFAEMNQRGRKILVSGSKSLWPVV